MSPDWRLRRRKPSPSPSPSATPTQNPSPIPTSSPGETVLWKAGDASLGHFWWYTSSNPANDYGQCGAPNGNTIGGGPVVSGASFWFNVAQNAAGTCYRNQVMPSPDSAQDNFYLTAGKSYTWTFTYRDSDASGNPPGMGPDANAASLIFQLHPDSADPCLALGFDNDASGHQEWYFNNSCGSNMDQWVGSYTPGETDAFKITVVPSGTSSGSAKLWRNGALVYSGTGQNYRSSGGGLWWNFGPYPWRWEAGVGGSTMQVKNATIDGMTLTTP